MRLARVLFCCAITWMLAACAGAPPPGATPTLAPPSATASFAASPTSSFTPSPKPTLTRTPAPTATAGPTGTPTSTPAPTATATPDRYAGLTIADLSARTYGGGVVQVEQLLGVTDAFTRTLVSYPSDGLKVYGFMDVPRRGDGPFPVLLVLHGYVDPAIYQTLAYTAHYADSLASAGYLVIHPNYRNYPPSDAGPNLFRVGYAVDILNLIALVRAQAGKAGPLALARPDSIGLWGHSMGGGIATRVMVLSGDVKAVVLYAAVSGDDKQNFEAIRRWSGGTRGLAEIGLSDADSRRISPIYYLDRVTAAVSIHHGEDDPLVPPAWSADLCKRLEALRKPVECFTYAGQQHSFVGAADALLIQRSIDFFDRHLK